MTSLLGHNISVSIKPVTGPRDFVWGKFYSNRLFYCNDEEIQEQLQFENEGILYAKRICKGANKEPTRLIRVKFSGNNLPKQVYCCGPVPYEITPYYPPVKRCARCQRYGHWASECRNEWACDKCGKNHNQDGTCQAPPFCMYCRANHSSSGPDCPKLQMEKEVVAISHESNVSFREARAKAESGVISYATVAKRNAAAAKQLSVSNQPSNVATGTTIIDATIIETCTAETGRDSVETSLEDDIERCKQPENLSPNEKVITARSQVINKPSVPNYSIKWSDSMSQFTAAFTIIDEATSTKKEAFDLKLIAFLNDI